MTLLPFLDCCSLLGVDPKTLRLWLKAANLSSTTSPTDARLKCLTLSQLHRLADLHGRSLPNPKLAEASSPASAPPSVTQTTSCLFLPDSSSADALAPSADLHSQLSLLQAQVATLQAQVTELALALVRERTSPIVEHAAPLLNPSPTPQIRASAPTPRSFSPLPSAATTPSPRPRPPSRALPLIEYRADGTYAVLSPTEGLLVFVPDSPEWFDWLATITSFNFVGLHGRFSARRKSLHGEFTRCWRAYRVVHHHQYWFYVGLTDYLTIARLEQVAVTVQTRLATL